MRVYFDNAATTPIHPEVIETMTKVMMDVFGNPSSIHMHGRSAKAIIEQARKVVAKNINSSIGDIFFMSSATEANNMILKGAVASLGVKRIITSPTEHPCILETASYIQVHGLAEIVFLDVDREGNIDLSMLENLLKDQEKKTLVSIMHINNEIGTICDISAVGNLCDTYGSLYHCDAVQSIGKYPIDVQDLKIHFLSGSAHKFHGPKGVGFVMISNAYILEPYLHGGAQERNMRAGTENIIGIAGLAKALEIGQRDIQETQTHIYRLREYMKSKIIASGLDIRYNGNQTNAFASHILSLSFPPGTKSEMLVMNLDIAGISASSGSACSAGIEEDSHVLSAINHDPRRKTIRFSFSRFNTIEEVDYVVEQIQRLI
jgi:cysteine desulfurase